MVEVLARSASRLGPVSPPLVGLELDGAVLASFLSNDLPEILPQLRGATLIACGTSAVFPGPVLNAMVEWSLAQDGRVCAIRLSDAPEWPRLSPARAPPSLSADPGFRIARCNGVAEEFSDTGRRLVAEESFLSRLAGANPYFAVCITGHGAEHCLSAGGKWLVAASGYGLSGADFDARDVDADLVFLNGCSTLRLSDSLVPAPLRLSSLLNARGIAVAGPYRNIRGAARIEEAFVKQVLAGQTAGQIVREINLLLRDTLGEKPCVILVGDPHLRLPAATRQIPPRRTAALPDSERGNVLADMRRAVAALRTARDFHADLRTWAWRLPAATAAAASVETLLRDASTALCLEAHATPPLDDLKLLQAAVARGRDALLNALADDAADWIRTGRWMQAAYAPIAEPAVFATHRCGGSVPCPRGDGELVDYLFRPVAPGGRAILARECDRCGSRAEWAGLSEAPAAPEARLEGETLSVAVGPLPRGEIGRILVHRCRHTTPLAWPPEGGALRFDMRGSKVRGRVTVVALSLGDGHIATAYAHVFRLPRSAPRSPLEESASA